MQQVRLHNKPPHLFTSFCLRKLTLFGTEHDDDIVRRDSLHAIINNLPDPNYATLRALCLHLHRVIDGAHVNRMNSHNLAVIFGPTLMGTDPSKAIADAGWQIKVIDTIIQNTYQIFDED
jgi:Rho GTPase-activating protein RGD1